MRLFNNKGSILALVVIIIAVSMLLGTSVLYITMSQMQIRKSNSELKKVFYLSENGLNQAYLRVYDLISEATEDSLEKADDYLTLYPGDFNGAGNIFNNNYKLYIISNVSNRIKDTSNPYTQVLNEGALSFVQNKLKIRVSSKYISESRVEKYTSADFIIATPNYQAIVEEDVDLSILINLYNFDL